MKDIENALPKRLYFSLDNAAKLLNCTRNDLIHFGAIGKLELCIACPNGCQIHGFNRLSNEVDILFEDIQFIIISKNRLIELEIFGTTSQSSFSSGYELFSGKMTKYYPHKTAHKNVPDKNAFMWEYRAYSKNSETESVLIEITPDVVVIEATALELF